jgi:hypothetical protein
MYVSVDKLWVPFDAYFWHILRSSSIADQHLDEDRAPRPAAPTETF